MQPERLVMCVPTQSSLLRSTEAIAARWNTPSTSRMASRTATRSATSPIISSTEAGSVLAMPARQIIENPHLVPLFQQRVREMRTDEAAAAGNEIMRHGIPAMWDGAPPSRIARQSRNERLGKR